MNDTFGQRLASAIKSSRQQHNHVATRLGVTRARLSDLRKDKDEPTYEEVEVLADILNTPSGWLLTGKHERRGIL